MCESERYAGIAIDGVLSADFEKWNLKEEEKCILVKKTPEMEIVSVELFDTEKNSSTVLVKVQNEEVVESFYVQTIDGYYRPDLGCWITTNSSKVSLDVDECLVFDLEKIIKKAESFIQEKFKIKV